MGEMMFFGASQFNHNIASWKTDRVTDMNRMFSGAASFNHAIGSWNTHKVEAYWRMFDGASKFNQRLCGWLSAPDFPDSTQVHNMFVDTSCDNEGDPTVDNVCQSCLSLSPSSSPTNNPTSSNPPTFGSSTIPSTLIPTSNPTSDASGIPSTLSPTSTLSAVDDIVTAVDLWNSNKALAKSKYGTIEQWDTSKITNMGHLFRNAASFNDDISSWDTTRVTDMQQMFRSASKFNQDISLWNVDKVTSMKFMFYGAIKFNQNLCSWVDAPKFPSQISSFYIFKNSGCKNPNLSMSNVCHSCS